MSPRRQLVVLIVVVVAAISVVVAPSAFGTDSVPAGTLTGSVSLVDQQWYC